MHFADKIELLMHSRGLNQETLAQALDLSQSTVSRWLNGTRPHRRVCLRIAEFFSISADDLVNDTVTCLRETGAGGASFTASKKDEIRPPHSTAVQIAAGVRMIPVFGMAQALGCRFHHGDLIPESIHGLPTVPVVDDGRTYAAFKVDGDSMAPRLVDGMIVLCDIRKEPTNKCVVVAKWDDTVAIKRYRQVGSKVLLTSDNPQAGEDFELHVKEIEWCLRVVRAVLEM